MMETRKGDLVMARIERIEWDKYFMMQAVMLAARSTCDRRHVGAVLVKDGRLIASGYNGAVSGTPHCDEVGHYLVDGHCLRAVHAEQNALLQLAKNGGTSDGAEIYVTDYPCLHCTKFLLQAGVKKINYLRSYRKEPLAAELLAQKNVESVWINLTLDDLKAFNFADYLDKK